MTLPVTRVTVHPDAARVTREGRATIEAGRLRLRALPLLLDPTSLRVRLDGAEPLEVRLELDWDGEDLGATPPELQRLDAALEALARTGEAIEALREHRDTLASLAPRWDDSDPERAVPGPEFVEAFLAAEQGLEAEVARSDDELRALRRRRAAEVEAVEVLRHQLEQASTEAAWRRWAPTRRVVVAVPGEGEVGVELSYRIPGATWSPTYTLDADGALRAGRFTLRALVVQATGEDWRGVRVSLSTAPSAATLDLPELPALRLGTRQGPRPAAWRELPPGLEALFPGDLEPQLPPPSPPPPAPAADDAPEAELLAELDTLSSKEVAEPPRAPQAKRAARPMAALSSRFAGPPPSAAPAPSVAPAAPGLGRAEPAPEADALELGEAWLDYGNLRLAPASAGPGRRGRLQLPSDDARLEALGLPAQARKRWFQRLTELRTRAEAAARKPLPPHHVVPGPIGGTDVRFEADGEVDVPSDGRFHSVAVMSEPARLEVSYRSIPRHDPRAFRRVTAALARATPLPPGPVDVVIDGRLELTVPWPGSPGRGRLELGLGAEDRLRVVRNVRHTEESAGVFGGNRRLQTRIEVLVASSLARPVRLELLDRVPVPVDPRAATVEAIEASPVAEAWTGDPDAPILKGGRRQWVDVPAGGEVRAVLGYSVTLSGKDELVGGDRRG